MPRGGEGFESGLNRLGVARFRAKLEEAAQIGAGHLDRAQAAGQEPTFAQHEGSMALLKDAKGFPTIESLKGRREASGTYAPLVYPSTYLGCTIDCIWYLELHPLGPDRTRLVHGALFPKSRLEHPDFEDVAKNYYHRWDVTLEEDIVASERQQRGVHSPFSPSGRFSYREPLVHQIDNWILDRVLDSA